MRLVLLCAVGAAFHFAASASSAGTLSGLIVNDIPGSGLVWDTFVGGGVTSFVKDGGTFLNDGSGQISIDVSTPGTYAYDLRLNKGTGREMANYRFRLFFDGEPDNGTPGIDVVAPRDFAGATPPFVGDGTHTTDGNVVTLSSVRVSSFNSVDEIGEFTPNPDGAIDYVGSFEFTVVPVVPEPTTALLALSTLTIGFALRRGRRYVS
jgi:hypothetical protein